MYKLLASDLDETLLNSDKKVSKENIEAIEKAEAMGVKFVTASGRGIEQMRETVDSIGQSTRANEYVISFNGGAVSESRSDEFLFVNGLSFDFANELYQKGQEYDVSVQVYTKEEIYIYNYTEAEKEFLEPGIVPIEVFEKDLDFLEGEEVVKILFMNEDHDYLEMINEDLKEMTKDCDLSYSSNRYLEFNQKGANKGAALEYLADYLGIAMEDTIVIGDNFNDLSMFERAGFSVGVKNMREELKSTVDYITESTNDEHAVAEVIEKFILNPRKG